MQKTLVLLAAIVIGTSASFSYAAQAKASKASQAQNASKPKQTMPHDMSGMSHGGHDMSGMKH